jgi:transposase
MITAEKNRLGFALESVQKRIRKHIRWLERELASVDSDLDQMIRSSPVRQAKSDLLREVPGVGPNLARTLIAELPELGRLSNKEIAALVGVAPLARDSGVMRGKRMVWGGRAPVRSALYLSIWSASKHNPVIKPLSTHACGIRLNLLDTLEDVGKTDPRVTSHRMRCSSARMCSASRGCNER